MLQKTVAANGTVRMVPSRDLKRYRSSHMLQKLRLALGLCFGMPHGIYPDVCDRVRGLDPPFGDELTTQPGYNTSPPPLLENATRD
jgi:hypothetical protein